MEMEFWCLSWKRPPLVLNECGGFWPENGLLLNASPAVLKRGSPERKLLSFIYFKYVLLRSPLFFLWPFPLFQFGISCFFSLFVKDHTHFCCFFGVIFFITINYYCCYYHYYLSFFAVADFEKKKIFNEIVSIGCSFVWKRMEKKNTPVIG